MAVGNGDQVRTNNLVQGFDNNMQTLPSEAPFFVYGTNEPYIGLTVQIGGFLYTTVGGALEGDSYQLVANPQSLPDNINPDDNNIPPNIGPGGMTDNPVVRTFVSRVIYYRQDGTIVPPGSDLHQHRDGTIMLGHDPINMGAIVTRTNPNDNGGGDGGNGGNTGGGVGPGPQPNPNPGMSGQSNPQGGKSGPGQGGPVGGY
tara:strand:+ start:45 stop:647 length:603 start_codon:yes stop_codon:yes gene_type:complete